MKLRNSDFGPIVGASGIQGFFGEGYPFHRHCKRMFRKGFDFTGMTFTAKTMTLHPKKGNMPLGLDGITPLEARPKCIHVTLRTWLKGAALNAVGLSNPGAEFLLTRYRFNTRKDNFIISFMSVEQTREGRQKELKEFVELLAYHIRKFNARVALQINFSCPNVGLHMQELVYEILCSLDIAEKLRIPLIPKINLLLSSQALKAVNDHPACDAICVSNTLPWGSLPTLIDWKGIFGTEISPLKDLGGGGLSGAPLLPLLLEWITESRNIITKPIIAGGGILGPNDLNGLSCFANLVPSLGSISFLRPWRIRSTIQRAKCMFD